MGIIHQQQRFQYEMPIVCVGGACVPVEDQDACFIFNHHFYSLEVYEWVLTYTSHCVSLCQLDNLPSEGHPQGGRVAKLLSLLIQVFP